MPKLTWDEISKIIHDIKEERTVISGAIMRLERADNSLERIENNLSDMVTNHECDE